MGNRPARRRHRRGRAALTMMGLLSTATAMLDEVQPGFPSSMTPADATTDPEGIKSVGGMNMGASAGSSAQALADTSSHGSNIKNLYFLLLFILLFVFILIFLILRRRRLEKLRRARDSSQSALARDIEGWAPSRSWPGNGWRSMVNRASRVSRASREEGLDERGEAPPAYEPGRGEDAERALAEAEATAQARRTVNTDRLRSEDTAIPEASYQQVCDNGSQVGIPLRSMVRWSASASMLPNPPEYETTIIDGSDRRRSLGQRGSSTDVIYQLDTNEIMAEPGVNRILVPRSAAPRDERRS